MISASNWSVFRVAVFSLVNKSSASGCGQLGQGTLHDVFSCSYLASSGMDQAPETGKQFIILPYAALKYIQHSKYCGAVYAISKRMNCLFSQFNVLS